MDEPTTHLDMSGIDALIGALKQFSGTLIFISHDGDTAAILGNAFAEDLGFKNVSVLKGGILQWLKEDRKLVSHKKDN